MNFYHNMFQPFPPSLASLRLTQLQLPVASFVSLRQKRRFTASGSSCVIQHPPGFIHVILLVCLTAGVEAQIDTLFSMARFDRESLKIRWSSSNLDLLKTGLNRGWQVQLYREGDPLPVRSEVIRSRPVEEIIPLIMTSGDSLVLELFEAIRSGATFFQDENQLDWYRFTFLFGLQDNFDLSKKLGFACEFTGLDTAVNYLVTVDLYGGGFYHGEVSPVVFQYQFNIPVPEKLQLTCKANQIHINGLMKESARHYASFYVEKRGFDEDSFKRINPLPLVVNYAYGDPLISFLDSIEPFGFTEYRIRGKDMWGRYGPYSERVKIDPCHLVYLPPHPFIIRETELRGSLQLHWYISDTLRHLLQGFNIYRSATKFGAYQLLNEQLLPPDVFEYFDHTPFKTGFYQVQAIYQGDIIRNSLVVPGILIDVTPPAIPENIQAELDTGTLIVTLKWNAVTDSDLKGYRVSRAHAANAPKFLLNNLEISETLFRDTLRKSGLHRKMYYWITTRDFSQNESFYSDSVWIELPPIYPPVAPRITHVQPENRFIAVYYDRSPSADAISHLLQRRMVSGRESTPVWQDIPVFPEEWNNRYIDSLVTNYDTVEYRVLVKGANGLTSVSNIRSGNLPEPSLLPAFEFVSAEAQDTIIVIYFDYPDQYRPAGFRLMGGTSPGSMKTVAVLDAAEIVLQGGVRKHDKKDLYTLYRYQLKVDRQIKYFKVRAIAENGKVSPFSTIFSY
jgi:hypothetical protein